MKLVIVESPAKAGTIKKYLGNDYVVKASYGHIADLAKGDKGIGVDVIRGFKPFYQISNDKVQILDEILNLSENSDEIFLSSDADNEGEYISYQLSKRLETTNKPIKRVLFKEITKDAIKEAFNNPVKLNYEKAMAAEARRILDRIVGFKVSPFLINFFGDNLSAGRVQSVCVRLIADRENHINTFVPQEYWNLFVNLKKDNFVLKCKCENKIKSKNEAEQIKNKLMNDKFIVEKLSLKDKKENPPEPLITVELQKLMAKQHSFDPEETMRLAQSLYESGLCTYIRTDSPRISEQAAKQAIQWLEDNNLPSAKDVNLYGPKKAAQDAHECIRPTDITKLPSKVNLMTNEKLVYKAIWQYFVASQMAPAIWSTAEMKIKSSSGFKFRISGKTLKEQGYLKIFGVIDNSKIDFPFLNEKDELLISDKNPVITEQKFTQPSPHFNQVSLLEELKKRKIGRPSTYAEISKKILHRNYVEKKGNSFYLTDLGKKINDFLVKHFDFLDYEYTSLMEKELDEIANGNLDRTEMLQKFFDKFQKELNKVYLEVGGRVCDKCNGPMMLKNKNGSKFHACTNFPFCKNILPIKI
jgi:DNA topoisomerase-1